MADYETRVLSDYRYLIDRFGREKILSRYGFLQQILDDYIIQNHYQGSLIVSQNILDHVVTDYFVDIDRLKDFQEIECTNTIKVYAYLSYWLLRHKPLQLVNSDEAADELAFANESCVSDFLKSYLFAEPDQVPILREQKDTIDEFARTLEYYFRYREYNAKSIELLLLAFRAGRGYQYCVDYQR